MASPQAPPEKKHKRIRGLLELRKKAKAPEIPDIFKGNITTLRIM
jgi:hypothetical protein